MRRLDDLLEALEQLNLRDVVELPDMLADRLLEAGVTEPHSFSPPELIEKVWALQQPLLITVPAERRRRRRRQTDFEKFFVRQV